VLASLARGVAVEGRLTAPAAVKLLRKSESGHAVLEITLTEGRKRQVKQMCSAVGHPVYKLRRIQFAFLTAKGLRAGEYRMLTPSEVRRLYRLAGLKPL